MFFLFSAHFPGGGKGEAVHLPSAAHDFLPASKCFQPKSCDHS